MDTSVAQSLFSKAWQEVAADPVSFLERKGDRNRATLAVDRDERVFEIRGQEVTAA